MDRYAVLLYTNLRINNNKWEYDGVSSYTCIDMDTNSISDDELISELIDEDVFDTELDYDIPESDIEIIRNNSIFEVCRKSDSRPICRVELIYTSELRNKINELNRKLDELSEIKEKIYAEIELKHHIKADIDFYCNTECEYTGCSGIDTDSLEDEIINVKYDI